jgi:hypothetical protein
VVAEPHVEASVIKARHLEVDLAVLEPRKDAHGGEPFRSA